MAPSGFVVLSNVPVTKPVLVSDLEVPSAADAGFSGLVVKSQEVPSVSAAPAGPGTSACTSLVVYVGKGPSPKLKAALAKHVETALLPLVEVAGVAAGKALVLKGTADEGVIPSRRRTSAIAALPTTHDAGLAIVRALAPDLPDAPPKLLCAEPRVVRQLR